MAGRGGSEMPTSPNHAASLLAAAAFAIAAAASAPPLAQDGVERSMPPAAAPAGGPAATGAARDGEPPPPPRPRLRRGEPDRSAEGAARRPLSPERIEEVIAAASEVVPEWGDRLRALRDESPEALDRAIAANGRRLVALSMLRQRSPELYRMKVEELRNHVELRRLGAALRASSAEGRAEVAAELRARVRSLAERQVDFGLRIRAEELAAMDAALRKMRQDLEQDAVRREQSISELLEAVEAGEELPEPDEIAVERSPRSGERAPPRGAPLPRPSR